MELFGKFNYTSQQIQSQVKQRLNIPGLEKLGKIAVFVGWADSIRNDDGQSVALYAKANNDGVYTGKVRIPARPFMRNAMNNQKYVEQRDRVVQKIVKRVNEEKADPLQELNLLGIVAVNNVRSSIRDGNWKPNAPSVKATKILKGKKGKKTSPKPLIDTGTMIQRIMYVVLEDK